MSLWHRHRWVETSRRFNPGHSGGLELAGFILHEQVMELVHGVTVVELRCDGCDDVKAVRYTGAAS